MLWMISVLAGCDSTRLGSEIYLLEGDRKEDRIIVKCTARRFNECNGGEYLIPRSYHDHMDTAGKYLEYVDQVKTDKNHIIATTVLKSTGEKRYWILVKSRRPPSEIFGPLDYNSFNERLEKSKVKLHF